MKSHNQNADNKFWEGPTTEIKHHYSMISSYY